MGIVIIISVFLFGLCCGVTADGEHYHCSGCSCNDGLIFHSEDDGSPSIPQESIRIIDPPVEDI